MGAGTRAQAAIFVCACALWACESNLNKAERLQTELAAARLVVLNFERVRDSLEKRNPRTRQDSIPLMVAWDSVFKAKARLDLVQREVNKFMSGR